MKKVILLLLCLNVANAHQLSTAYLNASVAGDGVLSGELQLALFDLQRAVGLDVNKNGELTWQEALSRQSHVQAWAKKSLDIASNEQACELSFAGQLQLDSHFNENYLVLPITAVCAADTDLTISYRGIFDIDSEHKLLLNISSKHGAFSRVLGRDNQTIQLSANSSWNTFKEYVKQGVIHIWIGMDHILFLLCLLFAVMLHTNKELPVKRIIYKVLSIVTAFTLAHSLTLGATAMGWIQFSSRWVEVGIALSVLLSAFNNIYPLVTRITWITFAFGLLHGMGFASVLLELGVPASRQFLSILAFNLGVELGQIGLIFISLPALILLKNISRYANHCLKTGSGLVAVMACFWVYQRLML
jgi:hypothetical protein